MFDVLLDAAVVLSVLVLGPVLIGLSTHQKTFRKGISVALAGLIFFEAFPLWYAANYMKMEPNGRSPGIYVFVTGKDWRERESHCYVQKSYLEEFGEMKECGAVPREELAKLRLHCGSKPYRFEERDPLREIRVTDSEGGLYYRPKREKRFPVNDCAYYQALQKSQ